MLARSAWKAVGVVNMMAIEDGFFYVFEMCYRWCGFGVATIAKGFLKER
jgi:hypothetical protein